jgi:hypothetical protein
MTSGSSWTSASSRRACVVAVACAAVTMASPAARAADPVAAEALFREGRALLDAGNDAAACEKLAASQRLDPAAGTALALGMCHERRGMLASGWANYVEAEALGRQTSRASLAAAAHAKVVALEPRLARVTVRVSSDAAIDGLSVTRDGVPVARAAWGASVPVDAGEHVIEASAPGHVARRSIVHVGDEARSYYVDVSPLEPVVAAARPADVAPLSFSRPLPEERSSGTLQRGSGLVLVTAGLAGIGVGTYFGLRAVERGDEARRLCPSSPCSDARGVALNDEAKSAAVTSTVGILGGAAAFLGGALLFFTAPSAPGVAAKASDRASVRLAPSAPGASLGASFVAEGL